jgi:hypothetical protein
VEVLGVSATKEDAMSSAFNHAWRRIEGVPAPEKVAVPGGPGYGERSYWRDVCSRPRCHEQIVAMTSHRYVTGRRGRVTTARRLVCERHLQLWIGKNPEAIQAPTVAWEKLWGPAGIRANPEVEE